AFLRQDIFSSTVAGAHFGVGEWLGQIAFAGSFAAAGWAGVAVLRATLLAVAAFFVVRLARRGGTPWWISLPLVVAALLVSKITWTDRPQLFTLALFPALLGLLLSLPTGFSRRLLILPPLFLVWTNLHGGYLLGLAIVAIFAVEAVLTRGRRGLPLALTAIACVAVTFLNPAPLELAGAAREDFLNPPRFLTEFLPPDVVTPAAALDTLRQDSGILLNEYDWGGYLIFNLPERPVFIDGRYVPYLGGVLSDYRALVGLRPGWRDLLDKYKVSELLLRPDRPLAVALREDGWRVRSSDADGRWIVLARP